MLSIEKKKKFKVIVSNIQEVVKLYGVCVCDICVRVCVRNTICVYVSMV